MPVQADQDRRDHQRRPITEPAILQQEERAEGAHHVLGAVREIDDVEHAEDHGEAETQHGVERAVDQPDQELAEQGLRRYAENFEHGCPDPSIASCRDGGEAPTVARHAAIAASPHLVRASARRPECDDESAADQRAAAVLERTERLVGRDGGASPCRCRRDLSIRLPTSPRTDTSGGSCGRRRAPCPCRTADRRSAFPSSWRPPPRRRRRSPAQRPPSGNA